MKRIMNMMVVKTLVLFVMFFWVAPDVKAYEGETVAKPTLTPAIMTTSFANDKNVTIEEYQTTDGYSCYTVPISCKKRGWVCIELDTIIPDGMYYDNINIGMRLYQDKACTKPVGSGQYKYMRIREFLQNKTYYLKIEKSASYGALNLKLKCYEYSTENTTMKEGKWLYSTSIEDNKPSKCPYHKIVIKKKGYITVTGNTYLGSNYMVSLNLCNNKKKIIYSSGTKGKYSDGLFAVQPGTYYLQYGGTSGETPYRIKYTFMKAPKYSNTTTNKGNNPAVSISKGAMKKAATLKKNKKTPLIYYTKDSSMKKHRWFKIKVTKKQVVTVYLGTTWSAPYIFDAKGNLIQTYSYSFGCRTYKKLKPGSYYIEAPASFKKQKKDSIGLVRMLYWY